MLYNDTQKHGSIESTATELQRDKNTEDSGISEGDSDSIGKPVNKPKASSAIMKQNKSKKAKTHKDNSAGESSKEPKARDTHILVNEAYYNANKGLNMILLKNTRKTSEKSKKCREECDDLLDVVVELESKTDSAKKATELVTTSINNHEKLLKNNNSKSKCIADVSIAGGAIIMACATFLAFILDPAIAIVGILGGIAFLYGLAQKVANCCEKSSYKKPNSTVESIDIEQGMHKNCKGLLTSIT